MATDPSPQRVYRAACPNCGAPVDFRSPASAFAVCSFCRSSVVREGDALRKIGESAERFDDHSPLQLGASGRYQGAPFTLVGRLQYGYADGTWNEWHALFGEGEGAKSGWLSEDNGRYVIAFDVPLALGVGEREATAVPAPERLRPGAPLTVNGERWSVGSVTEPRLLSAQGELPVRPVLDRAFFVADLRSPRGEVGTLDYSEPDAPRWSVGRSVSLGELALTGLVEGAEKTLGGRSLACPHCGAPLVIRLETTRSVVCSQCKSVVDIGEGVGAELAHYRQLNAAEPQIPLGAIGTLRLTGSGPLPWQVVGFVERCTVPEAGDDEDEQTFWREYLLYHRTEGFAFVIDAEDGWSWAATITGAPEPIGNGVKYQGVVYRKLYDYAGRVTYVLGEFYWQVTRDQLTRNSDYRGTGKDSAKRLNREHTDVAGSAEVVWSAGEKLDAADIRTAFRLPPEKAAALERDVLPTFSGAGLSLPTKVIFWIIVIVILLMLFRCDGGFGGGCESLRESYGEDSQPYRECLRSNSSGSGGRTSGGSYGGYSSGGGHK